MICALFKAQGIVFLETDEHELLAYWSRRRGLARREQGNQATARIGCVSDRIQRSDHGLPRLPQSGKATSLGKEGAKMEGQWREE